MRRTPRDSAHLLQEQQARAASARRCKAAQDVRKAAAQAEAIARRLDALAAARRAARRRERLRMEALPSYGVSTIYAGG